MSQEIAEEIGQQDQPITLATFQKEVVSLEQEFRGLLSALKDADQDLTSSNLEHILLLDSAAEATQVQFTILKPGSSNCQCSSLCFVRGHN